MSLYFHFAANEHPWSRDTCTENVEETSSQFPGGPESQHHSCVPLDPAGLSPLVQGCPE